MEAGSQRIGFGPFEPMFTMDLEGSKIYAFLATFLDGKQHMRDLGDLGCYSTYAKAINENLTVVAYSGTHLGPRWTGVSNDRHGRCGGAACSPISVHWAR